jgi:PEP-CTERM motif
MQIVSGDVIDAPTVPEPSFLGLLSVGVLALIGVHLLRNRRAAALRP